MKDTVLYYVIPCYNEEEVLSETAKRLYAKISQLVKAQKISPQSRILFVNDGSTDTTWEIIAGTEATRTHCTRDLCTQRNTVMFPFLWTRTFRTMLRRRMR